MKKMDDEARMMMNSNNSNGPRPSAYSQSEDNISEFRHGYGI
jgi:hypothetical protein